MNKEKDYWTKRYKKNQTGWDIGKVSTPIKEYIDQLKDTSISILIPGSGNGYEAEYLWKKGFSNVHILDVSEIPLKRFKKRNPNFPEGNVHLVNFFNHKGSFELILEQTFFCSMLPTDENRNAYAKHMHTLLKSKGKLVGLWFNFPLGKDTDERPFGGDKNLYSSYLSPFFKTISFDLCYNSITPRMGKELFGIFERKN